MTQGLFFRGLFILLALFVGYRGYRSFGSGELRIGNFKSPPTIILRDDRPRAYWLVVVFFYAIVLGLITLAAIGPTPS